MSYTDWEVFCQTFAITIYQVFVQIYWVVRIRGYSGRRRRWCLGGTNCENWQLVKKAGGWGLRGGAGRGSTDLVSTNNKVLNVKRVNLKSCIYRIL